jgi:hypothetical protein
MAHVREPLWTLDDLGAQVALALAVDYAGQASGRVRDVPDRRTIRYYTTLGLVDRPAAMRGRTALYGMRHLLQLVAIKRLQANGLSLAEIQARLVGLTDGALRQVARPPADFDVGRPSSADRAMSTDGDGGRPQARFWSAAPSAVAPEPPRSSAPRVLTEVPLEPGVTLFLEGGRPPDEHDLAALRLAAAPLLKFLHARRLVGGEGATSTKGETT